MCNVSIGESPCSQDQPTTSQDATPSEEPLLEIQPESPSYGSSVGGAIFNFTNCIVGAGAIGLGGAFAESGGLISAVTIIFFALLTKLSLDLVVCMSVEHGHCETTTTSRQHGTTQDDNEPSRLHTTTATTTTTTTTTSNTHSTRSASYEELGYLAFGQTGRIAVLLSKFLYSFGCLVAYIIVVKDNFAPALQHFIFGSGHQDNWFNQYLLQPGSEDTITWCLGIFVILPLCLLRDMTPLASLGAVSIASMVCIVLIVIYIYVAEPEIRQEGGSIYENWLEIRPGYVESWGTFVFTFVSQHTVNLAFESLKPEIRTVKNWGTVSSVSLLLATAISLTVGTVVYATFWESTQSDLFDMYPPMRIVDLAKILLCVTMLLTFPLPFFSCREMIIVSIIRPLLVTDNTVTQTTINNQISTYGHGAAAETNDLQEPLLADNERTDTHRNETPQESDPDSTSVIFEDPHERGGGLCKKFIFCYGASTADFALMLPGEEKQLALPFHVALTVFFWSFSTFLAIVSPNLGDILDLVGSASGTAMAFILPGLLSFKLQGYSRLALIILVVGGAVGFVGTICSLKKLIRDV